MTDEKLLPVRIIDPSRDFSIRNISGGSTEIKSFLPENQLVIHKEKLIGEVAETKDFIHKDYEKYHIPSLIKAKIHEGAISKSNRPKSILDKDTCPIVGIRGFGELLLSSTEKGMDKLKDKLLESVSYEELKILSSLKYFSKFDKNDRLVGISLLKLKEEAKRNNQWVLKLILVDHNDKEINKQIEDNFVNYCENNNIKVSPLTRLPDFKVWIASLNDFGLVNTLLDHPAIEQLSFFPSYKIVKREFEKIAKTPIIPQHDSHADYPSVAIIDSGISIQNQFICDWIKDRAKFLVEDEADYNHGTSVASLAAFAYHLNPDICIENDCLEVIDIQVLPKDYCDTPLTEDRLIRRLDEGIPDIIMKHKTKIFNMSLGFKEKKCEDLYFSSLGIYLDKLQEKYNIIIIVPSGNNEIINKQRLWPPRNKSDEEKLQVPADSVRSFCVGAIACKDRKDSVVKKGQPASYSCSGPGPAHTTKPDLVHYSGNISLINGDADISKQGIITLDAVGNLVEDVGTSYSSPLVARMLALLDNKIEDPSINLLKALTIHHCSNPLKEKEDRVIDYIGFGLPSSIDRMIGCNKHEITLIFEKEIVNGYHLECPFHWPESLIDNNGKCFGEIKMTLVAKVPLDRRYGIEYIRAMLTASLQKMKVNKKNEVEWPRQIKETIPIAKIKKLYGTDLVEHTYSWRPIKKYYRNLKKGIGNSQWRFKVELLLRDDVELVEPIPFVVIFTIKDPDAKRPIYDEVVNGLRNKCRVNTNPIRLRQRIIQKV